MIKEEITRLLEAIVEETETINKHTEKIPHIELDILLKNIQQLYECYLELTRINNLEYPPVIEKAPKETQQAKPGVKSKPIHFEENPIVIEKLEAIHVEMSVAAAPSTEKPRIKEEPKKMGVDLFSDTMVTVADKYKDDRKTLNEQVTQPKKEKSVAEKIKYNPITDLKSAIGINEKFRFINELFNGDMQGYNNTIDELNKAESQEKAEEMFCQQKALHNWDDANHTAQLLLEFIQRKFA